MTEKLTAYKNTIIGKTKVSSTMQKILLTTITPFMFPSTIIKSLTKKFSITEKKLLMLAILN